MPITIQIHLQSDSGRSTAVQAHSPRLCADIPGRPQPAVHIAG